MQRFFLFFPSPHDTALTSFEADVSLDRIFRTFLKSEGGEHEWEFVKGAFSFRSLDRDRAKRRDMAKRLINTHFVGSAPEPVKVAPGTREALVKELSGSLSSKELFDAALDDVAPFLEMGQAKKFFEKDSVVLYLDMKKQEEKQHQALEAAEKLREGHTRNTDVRRLVLESWINYVLAPRGVRVHHGKLFRDLRDGIILSNLVEVLSGKLLARWKAKGLTNEVQPPLPPGPPLTPLLRTRLRMLMSFFVSCASGSLLGSTPKTLLMGMRRERTSSWYPPQGPPPPSLMSPFSTRSSPPFTLSDLTPPRRTLRPSSSPSFTTSPPFATSPLSPSTPPLPL